MSNYPKILGDYESHVESLFDQKSPVVITNGLPAHAAILIAMLFRKAKEQVVVFCQDLNPDIYSRQDVMDAITQAIGRGIKVRFVTQSSPKATELVCKLQQFNEHEDVAKQVQLRRCKPSSNESNIGVNFAVMDDTAFRFEPNKREVKAQACANNNKLASKMMVAFEKIFDVSENILGIDPSAPNTTYTNC
jgi:hypothetical protein